MGKEIERKFLVKNDSYKQYATCEIYQQGFLNTDKERVVRVRIVNENAFLTIKGVSSGIARKEFEYEIPLGDAEDLIANLCIKPTITKTRYFVSIGEQCWEVDEFAGENEGLVIAEIELKKENQASKLPEWIGEEVTGDERYYNANLIAKPYKTW